MTTPTDDPDILHEWRKILSEYVGGGSTKSDAYYAIAGAYGVSYTTVRYHLDPFQRSGRRRYHRERYRRLSRMKKRIRRYGRNYRRLTRHPERFLSKIFEETEQLSVNEIAAALLPLTDGTRFRPKTVQKLLSRYTQQARGPPYLQEDGGGVYRVRGPPGGDADKGTVVNQGSL